jgi:hypothetical protein
LTVAAPNAAVNRADRMASSVGLAPVTPASVGAVRTRVKGAAGFRSCIVLVVAAVVVVSTRMPPKRPVQNFNRFSFRAGDFLKLRCPCCLGSWSARKQHGEHQKQGGRRSHSISRNILRLAVRLENALLQRLGAWCRRSKDSCRVERIEFPSSSSTGKCTTLLPIRYILENAFNNARPGAVVVCLCDVSGGSTIERKRRQRIGPFEF